MADWSIAGSWVGRYWYDPSDKYPVSMPNVAYTLTLTQGWFGRFRGRVRDDVSEGGMPEQGIVEGRVRGLQISFLKRMPVCYVCGATGSVSLRQYLRDTFEMDLDEDVLHPGIRYEGEYDQASDTAIGSWQFESKKAYARSRGQLIEIPFLTANGKWEMSRQSGA